MPSLRFAPVLILAVVACRIEKARTSDSTTLGADPGPGVPACGISPESRVSEDGIGLLRIGSSIDALRQGCSFISEKVGANDAPMQARIDLGRDTADLEFVSGALRRITLHHQAYRTADSLGVGTHISRLLGLRDAVGLTERNKLYAMSPAYCGLRFMMEDPAPGKQSAQSGRAALRRLSGETRVRQLEIVGCQKRR